MHFASAFYHNLWISDPIIQEKYTKPTHMLVPYAHEL